MPRKRKPSSSSEPLPTSSANEKERGTAEIAHIDVTLTDGKAFRFRPEDLASVGAYVEGDIDRLWAVLRLVTQQQPASGDVSSSQPDKIEPGEGEHNA